MEELFEGEHTEVLARVTWARRRPSMVWLLCAVIALAAAIAVTLLAPAGAETVDKETVKSIEAVAADLGKAVDAAAATAHARADKLAGVPAMRAGILTDAATVADVLRDEMKVALSPGETLEVFQIHDGKTTSLVRMPQTAAALPTIRDRDVGMVHLVGNGLEVVVGAPIEKIKTGEGYADRAGEVVLAVPVELDALRARLAEHARSALLQAEGSSQSFLATPPKGMAVRAKVPSKTAELSLAAVPMTTSHHAEWLEPLRYAIAGLGAALVLAYLLIYLLRKPVPRRF